MRRASVKVPVFRARRTLVAMSLAALLALALAVPADAQEETTAQTANETQAVTKDKDASGKPEQSVQGAGQQAGDATEEGDEQAAARTTDSLQDAAVTIETDSDGTANRIEIAAADCDVDKGATVTVSDGDTSETFVDAVDPGGDVAATIESSQDQIVVDDFQLDSSNFGAGGNEDAEVTGSTGITCGRDAAANTENENDDENGGDDTKTADDLENLNCDDLLVLFRAESSSGQQYGAASGFADSEVRAQVEVCLEKEIVQGTAADEDLPDTGGLSLIGLAVLGVVSAVAGLSVIRGGRRRG